MRSTTALLAAVLALSTAGCSYGPYALKWSGGKPPGLKRADRSALLAERVRVEYIDHRPEPRSLFGYHGDRGLHTEEDVAAWAGKHFDEALRDYGVTLADASATLVVRVIFSKILVTDGDLFRGHVEYDVEAWRPGQDQPIWRGAHHSVSKRWGNWGKLGGHYTALSNAVLDAARDLMESPGFIDSVGSNGARR